ncbi:MAG: hypothetical protein ACJ71Y_07330 [Blastococcus sp.]
MSDELEQRLRDSLRAYADRVDAPDDGSLPAPRATPLPVVRRWRGAILVAAAAAAVVTGTLVVLDVRDPGSPSATGSAAVSGQGDTRAEASESASGTPSDQALSGTDASAADGVVLPPSPEPGIVYTVELYTHCGVRGIDIGGLWFAADPPLVEEGSRPPPDWGNPDQRGTVTLLTATEAVFRDDVGHEVRLRADESARPPLCE